MSPKIIRHITVDPEKKTPFSKEQLQEAYWIWQDDLPTKDLDQQIRDFLSEKPKSDSDGESKLKIAREALCLSSNEIANRLGIKRSSYVHLEKVEKTGGIQLRNLERAAEAMDCELVYVIRPKSRRLYSREIWEKLLPFALEHPSTYNVDEVRKSRRLASIVKMISERSQVRHELKISKRGQIPLF